MERSILHAVVKGLILGFGLLLIFFAYIGMSAFIGRWPAAMVEIVFVFSYLYNVIR